MENFTVLNYQGSKNNLSSFIKKNIEPYIQDGKAILDIFSGSAAVSNMFRDNYQVYANDTESYASIIADAILNQPDINSATELISSLDIEYTTTIKKHAKPVIDFVKKEQLALDKENYEQLIALYNLYPTVWNNQYSGITKNKLTVDSVKQTHDFYLFTTYYATNYYGINQALDIDCLIKIINLRFPQYRNALLSCLFYAMKETVFLKMGIWHNHSVLKKTKLACLFNAKKMFMSYL